MFNDKEEEEKEEPNFDFTEKVKEKVLKKGIMRCGIKKIKEK